MKLNKIRKNAKPLVIEWYDAFSEIRYDKEKLKHENFEDIFPVAKTAGWIIYEDDTFILLATEMIGDQIDITGIPRSWIKKVR
jgi:hypothetical protein